MGFREEKTTTLVEAGHKKLDDCFEKLQQFGKVEKVESNDTEFEVLITEGFSTNATNTFECMNTCIQIAKDYPYAKKMVSNDNMFHLILTKSKT